MEDLAISFDILAVLFFIVALAYSSVGLGGGSSYVALMTIFGINYLVVPVISLTLNLLVTTIGSFNFLRKRHGRLRLILPFFVSSIPMAYVGGLLKVGVEIFQWLLLLSLVIVILRIYFWKSVSLRLDLTQSQKISVALLVGSVLGLVAGIVGIGGGIYLVPLIIILGLGTEKEAAACGAIFVWVNSLSGLAARIQHNPIDLTEIIPLIIAVLSGGFIGSFMGSSRFSPAAMQQILGAIIVIAVILLSRKMFFL
ncbi:MAG: sulfite exporter TauE/SafE family protein [Gammaproteobacteria bacterium]|nr:sulfite exporter TauE/SafE family protein [Gammaproteobacteria bacterium]